MEALPVDPVAQAEQTANITLQRLMNVAQAVGQTITQFAEKPSNVMKAHADVCAKNEAILRELHGTSEIIASGE